jgi:purine-binding chemotaxis protein CheW
MNVRAELVPVLLTRLEARLCAIPLSGVVECMRPLPIEPTPGVSFLMGVSVIRGAPVPVVHLATLVGGTSVASTGRFVLLRLGTRRAALAVEAVVGVRSIDDSLLQQLPPLLQGDGAASVAAVGVNDGQLLLLLQLARVVPEDVWQALDANRGPG